MIAHITFSISGIIQLKYDLIMYSNLTCDAELLAPNYKIRMYATDGAISS